MINPTKLNDELIAAGIQISGCNSNGKVWDPNGAEIQNQPAVQTVIAAHDPTDYVAIRSAGAEAIAASIPNWAGWSAAEWATYRDANVSATQINAVASLADAKVIMNKMAIVLNNLALMEIALRNRVFPKLEDL